MIELAQAKMPEAKLYQGDFSKGLVPELCPRQYDAIIATYSLHHLTDAQKIDFLRALLPLLKQDGCIFIGDVAFRTRDELEACRNAAEVEALAKLIYGEAGIVPSTTEQAAVVWCVLNRVDDPRFPDTVLEVIEAPYQFSGYDPEYPVKEEFALLAADVLTRYRAERDGEENVGRVLPAEYCFFTGDGRRNHFTTEWKSTDCFGWTIESPYTD